MPVATPVDVGTCARGRHESPRREERQSGTQLKQANVTNSRFASRRETDGFPMRLARCEGDKWLNVFIRRRTRRRMAMGCKN